MNSGGWIALTLDKLIFGHTIDLLNFAFIPLKMRIFTLSWYFRFIQLQVGITAAARLYYSHYEYLKLKLNSACNYVCKIFPIQCWTHLNDYSNYMCTNCRSFERTHRHRLSVMKCNFSSLIHKCENVKCLKILETFPKCNTYARWPKLQQWLWQTALK